MCAEIFKFNAAAEVLFDDFLITVASVICGNANLFHSFIF
jgi:hypothetical protein